MGNIIVSACLLGCECRYKGDAYRNEEILALAKAHTLIPVCPEQLGGLCTPRNPAERQGNRVISNAGVDVTEQYQRGAEIAARIAALNGAQIAILKANSPSCGKGSIYDGSFTGAKCPGNGVTTDLFLKRNIAVFSEEELMELKIILQGTMDTAD